MGKRVIRIFNPRPEARTLPCILEAFERRVARVDVEGAGQPPLFEFGNGVLDGGRSRHDP